MKNILLVLVALMVVSCSNDEGAIGPDPDDEALEGQWTLNNVSCFCAFEEGIDFSTTKISFDTKNNELQVLQSGDSTFFKEAGFYKYNGEGTRIEFPDGDAYTFYVKGDAVLQLVYEDNPDIADDEISYSFER
jgi:hypothetical protein